MNTNYKTLEEMLKENTSIKSVVFKRTWYLVKKFGFTNFSYVLKETWIKAKDIVYKMKMQQVKEISFYTPVNAYNFKPLKYEISSIGIYITEEFLKNRNMTATQYMGSLD